MNVCLIKPTFINCVLYVSTYIWIRTKKVVFFIAVRHIMQNLLLFKPI
jgi:hypothetical protein